MTAVASTTRTQVAIVGGGPAGLMTSHLLAREGVDSVVIDDRTHEVIATTHRAGILEQQAVRLLVDSGASDRVLADGHEHEGISLRFDGESHRIDFQRLVGASCWLYPQTDVFVDLHATRTAAGGDLRYGVSGAEILDVTEPRVRYADADGAVHEIVADYVVGSDGSRSIARAHVPDNTQYFREYPFAWFGVLVETPRQAPELIYSHSEHGFALVSQRTETVQRLYFQCDPAEDASTWSDDRIWEQLQRCLAGRDGYALTEGPVIEKSVLPFRSFVQTPLQHGRLFLAGDAGHTVPPTGAKGLNLALADVALLGPALIDAVKRGDTAGLETYTDRALKRVWRAQHFSYWMTTMLHTQAGAHPFDEQRRIGELRGLVESERGSAYLAEGYTGWPA